MSRLAGLTAALLVATFGPARAERLTVALSTPESRSIRTSPATTVTVFGVIDRDAESVSGVGGYDVAVLLVGPQETVVARRKDRILGIWANAASETFDGGAIVLFAEHIGGCRQAGHAGGPRPAPARLRQHRAQHWRPIANPQSPAPSDFRKAFVRLKRTRRSLPRAGRRQLHRRADLPDDLCLPANIPVGAYTAEAYLFSDRPLIARAEDRLDVSKTGVEADCRPSPAARLWSTG